MARNTKNAQITWPGECWELISRRSRERCRNKQTKVRLNQIFTMLGWNYFSSWITCLEKRSIPFRAMWCSASQHEAPCCTAGGAMWCYRRCRVVLQETPCGAAGGAMWGCRRHHMVLQEAPCGAAGSVVQDEPYGTAGDTMWCYRRRHVVLQETSYGTAGGAMWWCRKRGAGRTIWCHASQ